MKMLQKEVYNKNKSMEALKDKLVANQEQMMNVHELLKRKETLI